MRSFTPALFCVVSLLCAPAHAAIVRVTTTSNDGAGSLRAALTTALAGDTIVFALPGVAPHTIDVDNPLSVKRNVTILGPGSALLTISKAASATGPMSVFEIDTGITTALVGMTIANGTGAQGGCINDRGTSLSLSGVVVRDCIATDTINPRGGGVFVNATAGVLDVVDATFSNCRAAIGGGIALDDGNSDAHMEDVAFDGNSATIAGGGLYHGGHSLELVRGRFTSNLATGGNSGGGAGLYVSASAGGTVVAQSTFTGNTSTGEPSFGGGIAANHLTATQSLRVDSSLFAANTAQLGAGLSVGQTVSTTRVVNCTFSQNIGPGATAFTSSPSAVVALHVDASTFVGNTRGLESAAQDPTATALLVIRNSILANATDITGTAYSLGHNIVSSSPAGFGPDDLVSTDPLVGALADNGGPTQTIALLPTSPAIDAGSCTALPPIFPDALTVDQRGASRADRACDIGAYEDVVPPTGPQGPPGPQGPAGPTGNDGADGSNGVDGTNGVDGAAGPQGADGPQGPAGAPGADGAAGEAGGCAAMSDHPWAVALAVALLATRRRAAQHPWRVSR